MNQMQDTSLEEMKLLKPHLNNCEQQVLDALTKLGYATNSMIAEELGWSINRVTGRVFSLREKKEVFFSHPSRCPLTKRKAHYWTTKLRDDE